MMNHDIFISYSSKQKSIADGVCHYLEENGFKCWMAPRDIPVGSEYGDLIEEAIKTSKVVVLVFSQAASISKWVKGEINVAFTEDKPILPFRIDETEIKGGFRVMLNQMHWIDAFPQYADRLPDLLSSICGLLGRQARKVNVQNGTTNSSNEKPNQSEKGTNIINSHEYVDLGLPSGTLWATCNVGATKPEDCGDYFSWGEIEPKIDYSKKCYSYTNDDPAKANWGGNWLLPTIKQWEELLKYTTNMYVNLDGVRGRLFTSSKKERLFLPAAGFYMGRRICFNNRHGYYWSNSLRDGHPTEAKGFFFSSGRFYKFYKETALDGGWSRDSGFSVRPVCSAK